MLKDGDALEIKSIRVSLDDYPFPTDDRKITDSKNLVGNILLSNVPPMQMLYKNDPLISKNCRESKDLGKNYQRDIAYFVGVIEEKKLRCLSIVYGRDYCASNDYYNNIRRRIKKLYENEELIHDNLETSKELAITINVDPLSLTSAKLYAHWQIKNPWQAFNYVYRRPEYSEFDFFCIISEDKLKQFNNFGALYFLEDYLPNLKISEIVIRNPNTPKYLRDAILITYRI